LTREYRTRIPPEVRRALRLEAGDVVRFEIDGDRVVLRRPQTSDLTYLKGLESTLSEWSSPYDDEAYAHL
jgi:bifunctional DNA-binding transcriptional regulator/antitoxin component of YhaV-PrlF toxin-antitoxin module